MMAPTVAKLAEAYEGKVKVGKINVDENMTIAQKYRVASIPNFVIFRDGQPVANFVGAMSEADFREKLEQVDFLKIKDFSRTPGAVRMALPFTLVFFHPFFTKYYSIFSRNAVRIGCDLLRCSHGYDSAAICYAC